MPIHSLVICDKARITVLFGKHFDTALLNNTGGPLRFEKCLLDEAKYFWSSSNSKQSFFLEDILCIMEDIGELIVVVCGTDDFDEAMCKFGLLLHVLSTLTDAIF